MTNDSLSGRTAGFAMRDMVVGLGLAFLVGAVLLAGGWLALRLMFEAWDKAKMGSCRNYMGSFAAATATYKEENQNRLPALFRVGDPGMPLGSATLWGEVDDRINTTKPEKARAMRQALGSNALQNFWLLLGGEYMGGGEAAIRCPADEAWAPRNIPRDDPFRYKYGWTDARNVSYGLHFPYAALGKPVLPGEDGRWPELPTDTRTWNRGDPNGLLPGEAGAGANAPMYPDNGIYLADRNPRRTWEAPLAGNSNHENSLNYLEKGGNCSVYEGVDGKAGLDRDDIYQARGPNRPTGLPCLAPDGLDPKGLPTIPCTDAVIWPLDQRRPK